MIVIFVTPADIKKDSDVSASYGSLNHFSCGITKITIMNDCPSHSGIYSIVMYANAVLCDTSACMYSQCHWRGPPPVHPQSSVPLGRIQSTSPPVCHCCQSSPRYWVTDNEPTPMTLWLSHTKCTSGNGQRVCGKHGTEVAYFNCMWDWDVQVESVDGLH